MFSNTKLRLPENLRYLWKACSNVTTGFGIRLSSLDRSTTAIALLSCLHSSSNNNNKKNDNNKDTNKDNDDNDNNNNNNNQQQQNQYHQQ